MLEWAKILIPTIGAIVVFVTWRSGKLIIAFLLVGLILTGVVHATTTVVKVSIEDVPYNQDVSVFIDEGQVFLVCNDNYGDAVNIVVQPDDLLAVLNKALEWIQLNKTVKADVQKRIPFAGERAPTGLNFFGTESGYSATVLTISSSYNSVVCSLNEDPIRTLVSGITNNLENAKTEDAKNKEDLFK